MIKIAIKYLTVNKRASRTIILGIALSVMFMSGLLQMGDGLISEYKKLLTSGAKRDFTIRNISNLEIEELIVQIAREEIAEAYLATAPIGTMYYDKNSKIIHIIGFDGDIEYFKSTKLLEGRYPEEYGEICIEEVAGYTKHKPAVGEMLEMEIDYENGTQSKEQFKIVGILQNVIDEGEYIYTNLETANKIAEKNKLDNNRGRGIGISVKKDTFDIDDYATAVDRIRNILVAINEDYSETFYKEQLLDNEQKSRIYEDEDSYKQISYALKVLAVIIAICEIIFIYNAFSIYTAKHVKQFGIMRCLGLDQKQQFGVLAIQAIILANIGFVIGAFGGLALVHIFSDNILNGLLIKVRTVDKVTINFMSYMHAYLLSFVAIFLGNAKIIYSLNKAPIVESLRYTGNVERKSDTKVRTLKKYNSFTFVTYNIKRNMLRSSVIVIIMTTGMCIFIVIGTIFWNFRYKIQNTKQEIATHEIFTNTMDGDYLKKADIDSLHNEVICETYLQYLERNIFFYDEQTDTRVLIVVYSNNLFEKLVERNQNLKKSNYLEEAITVMASETKEASKQLKLANWKSTLGAQDINYRIPCENSFLTYEEMSNNSDVIIINEIKAKELGIPFDKYSAVLLNMKDDTAIDIYGFFQQQDGNFIYGVNNLYDSNADDVEQILSMATLALYILGMILFLSMFIIGNAVVANLHNRKEENFILRALGLEKRELEKLIYFENIYLFFIAFLFASMIACLLCLAISAALDESVRGIHLLVNVIAFALYGVMTIGISFIALHKEKKENTGLLSQEEV